MNADLLLPFVWSPSPVIDVVGGGVGPKLGSNIAKLAVIWKMIAHIVKFFFGA